MKNFLGGMFGPVGRGMCRLTMDGNIAIKSGDAYKTYNAETKSFINCDDFVFDIGEEMFFVVPTNTVATGDIILTGSGTDRSPRYVLEVKEDSIKTINYKTGTIEDILPERHVFMGNTYFYGKIVSMFGNAMEGGAENIMKYMMMSQMFKGSDNSAMNPMAMMMLMNSGSGFGDIFGDIFNKKEAKKKED